MTKYKTDLTFNKNFVGSLINESKILENIRKNNESQKNHWRVTNKEKVAINRMLQNMDLCSNQLNIINWSLNESIYRFSPIFSTYLSNKFYISKTIESTKLTSDEIKNNYKLVAFTIGLNIKASISRETAKAITKNILSDWEPHIKFLRRASSIDFRRKKCKLSQIMSNLLENIYMIKKKTLIGIHGNNRISKIPTLKFKKIIEKQYLKNKLIDHSIEDLTLQKPKTSPESYSYALEDMTKTLEYNHQKKARSEAFITQGRRFDSSFISTNEYSGVKPGYCFKFGVKGLGYYTLHKKKEINDSSDKYKMATSSGISSGAMNDIEKNIFRHEQYFTGDVNDELLRVKTIYKDNAKEYLPGWGSRLPSRIQSEISTHRETKIKKQFETFYESAKPFDRNIYADTQKLNKRSFKYRTPSVPYGFHSAEEYESTLHNLAGREFNPAVIFRNLTRPAIQKDFGRVIGPINQSNKTYNSCLSLK